MSTPQDPFASPPEDRGSTPPPTPPAPAWGTPPPGSTPPQQQGWGAPPPGQSGWGGPQGPPPQQGSSNGVGTAALVVGLLALVTSIFFIGGLLGVVAIVLGAVGLGKVKRHEASNKGMAVAGIVLGAISLLVVAAMIAFFGWIFSTDAAQELADCLESAGGDSAAQAECQREFEDSLTG